MQIQRTPFYILALVLAASLALPAGAEDAPPSPAADSSDDYSDEDLEEIVGPIALYPDIVLDSVLPASTFPTDVVQAARWVDKQEGEIESAPENSGWDGSVEALVQFPRRAGVNEREPRLDGAARLRRLRPAR